MRFSSLSLLPLSLLDVVQSTYLSESDEQAALTSAGPGSWNLSKLPSPNSTFNFLFDTANSLLQHWPNTRLRNGHTVVPATIPTGTLLYHGTFFDEIPKEPEWVSVNPETSYAFCSMWSSLPDDDPRSKIPCWHLTLTTTRPLRLLYFDGNSGANIVGGPLDTQDLVTWGKVEDERVDDDYARIGALCKWGEKYGLDGFVRMEMDFEIMLCNFTTGVRRVSFLNLAGHKHSSSISPGQLGRALQSNPGDEAIYRMLEAGSWANHYPGDTRIKLDYSRLLSFYDAGSFPSVLYSRVGQERWGHRAGAISAGDVQVFLGQLDRVLLADTSSGSESGVDWRALLSVISTRYSERLELLGYILDSISTSTDEENDIMSKAFNHVRSVIIPYILASAIPPVLFNFTRGRNRDADHAWAAPVYKLCSTTHTAHLFSSDMKPMLTPSEKLFRDAARGVEREICRVLVNIWAEGEEIYADSESGKAVDPSRCIANWRSAVADLVKWLDWSVRVRCAPACGVEERCFLPTVPFFGWRSGFRLGGLEDADGVLRDANRTRFRRFGGLVETLRDEMALVLSEEDWRRPQPRCVRRVAPFTGWK